ncbi:MAG: SRPBCC family protein [Nitriliruptor sp.]|uniref:SRPBCC family protein n=1 Tax=Nitriliruptor sp. TaxID=2448056 RepID=UPI0034A01963
MPRFEETRTIGASGELCWQLLTDPDHIPTWLTIATSVRAAGELGEGTPLHARGGALGVNLDLQLEVAAWEPTCRYAWRLHEPVAVDVIYALDPVEVGLTRLRARVEADLGRRVPVRARLAVRVLRGELSRSLDRLAELAEATPG